MIKNFAICIPHHSAKLNKDEIKNIKISIKNNDPKRIYFVLPQGINKEFYKKKFPNIKISCFDDDNFINQDSYNQFLLKPEIYSKFSKFKFLVICQTDAVLTRNISEINLFNYDYIGAPWSPSIKFNIFDIYGLGILNKIFKFKKKKLFVGNGGLSIRRNSKFLYVSKNLKLIRFIKCGEDVFYSYMAKKLKIKISGYNFSNSIFRENTSRKMSLYKINKKIFGYHALEKWSPQLRNLIYKEYDFKN